MALSYPLPFPAIARFRDTPAFDLNEALAVNQSGAGELETMELADPAWSAKWQTPVLTDAHRAAWTAWRMALTGGAGFLGHDPGRPWPLAYGAGVLNLTRHGGGAFDGTAKLTGFDALTLQISTLPDLYAVSAGDRASVVRPNGQRSLHEVIEAAAANSSGVVTVSVMPAVPADVVLNSTAVQLVRPTAVFILKPGTFSAPSGVDPQPVAFEGMQTTAPQN
jgi:hypothetical protein